MLFSFALLFLQIVRLSLVLSGCYMLPSIFSERYCDKGENILLSVDVLSFLDGRAILPVGGV